MARRGRLPLREELQQLDSGMDNLMAEGSDDDLGMDSDDDDYNYDSEDSTGGINHLLTQFITLKIV